MSMKTVLKKLTSMVLVICMFVSLAAPAVGDAPLPQPTEEAVLPDGTTVYADGSLVYADGTIVYADGTTVRADGTTADANGTVVYPDGTMLYADGKMVYANGTAVYPDGTTVYADGTVFYPDGTIVYADGTTVRADGVTVNPDGTTVYPDGTTIYTDGTIVYADGTRAYPDGTVVYADGTTLNPDGSTVYPDGTTVYADGTTLNPDGSTVYPDGTTVYADGTTLYPDGSTVYPDGTTVYADGTTLNPDGSTVYPDGTTVYADGTTLKPDGSTVYPDGTTVYADGTTLTPDGTTVYADGTTLKPDGSTVYPDGTTVYADGTTVYTDGTTVYPDGSTDPLPEEEPVVLEEPEPVVPADVTETPEETPADPVILTDPTTAEETQPATDPATDGETEESTEPVTETEEANTETEEAGAPEEDEENKTEETSEESAEKTTEETAEGTTEKNTEETAEQTTEKTAEETAGAAPAEELPLRTLTVSADQMAFRDQFLNPKEPVLWSGSVWSALYGTAIEPVYADGHVMVEISGHLPETVTARAMFVEFTDPGAAQNDERALMLLDVALLDETGAFYVPAEALHVSVSDASISGAVANGEPFAAYFDDAYDGLGDAGDVRVGMDDNIDGDRLAFIPGLRDTLLFWEAGDRLVSTENGTVDFDSNRFPFRFVLSAQQEPREEAQPEEQNPDEQPAEQQNAVKDVMLSGTLVASDGYTYEVSVSYPADCGLPVGAELSVEELIVGTDAYWDYINQSAAELGVSPADLSLARAFDISLVDPATGVHYQPTKDVQVSILLISTPVNTEEEISVLHFDDEAGAVQPMDIALNGEAIEFETGGFSVYVVLQRVIEKTLTASDGNTYQITVDYDSASGIPNGVELNVQELLPGTEEYLNYIAHCAAELGLEAENFSLARAFDISLIDPATGITYQPNKYVKVSIQLLDQQMDEEAPVDVLHFGDEVEAMNCALNGEAVEFATNGFSVYVILQRVIEKTLTAGDGNTYHITVDYDSASGIPNGVELSVSEIREGDEGYEDYIARSAEQVGADVENLNFARAFDITLTDPSTGISYQPNKDVKVSIQLLDQQLNEEAQIDVLHFGDEVETMDCALNGEAIEFAANGFSVYVIVSTTISQTLTASDGNEYLVTVTYDNTSGIPADAELYVSEIKEGEAGYEDYVAQSAAALGEKPENLAFARAFDITLKNPRTGEEYQPNKNVAITIELLRDDLNSYASVDVVHIHDEAGREAEVMDSTVYGESVEFTTDGFSVYVLTGVFTYTYEFYAPTGDVPETVTETGFTLENWSSYYSQISVQTETGTAYSQTVKNGETPVIPQLTDTSSAAFAGWFEGDLSGTSVSFGKNSYDFDNVEITENRTIRLFARFSTFAEIIFHDQYNSSLADYPVMYTRRGELVNGSANIKISDVSATYSGSEEYAFYGWSETPVQNPGDTADLISPVVDGCIAVTGPKHLYPVFQPFHWLRFYSAYTGSGATYVPQGAYFDGDGPTALTVPVWEGHTFLGWFNGDLTTTDNGDGTTTDTVTYSTQITNADGSLIAGVEGTGVRVYGGKLTLSADTTLYAKWSDAATVNYTIIIWKQKTTDADGLENSAKSYDFVESIVKAASIGATVSVDSEFIERTYTGFSYNRCDGEVTVNPSGYTVLNVYYDKDAGSVTGASHTLTFRDSVTGTGASAGLPVTYGDEGAVAYETPILTGNNGGSFVPADPTPGRKGFSFSGWYADENCSTRVFFDKSSYDAYRYSKVLYETMPNEDLTIYAGWSADWYIVQIDPNYGTFNGSGGTWFWETVDGDYIREYTQITRDYVPSSSGTYYYAKHDRAYYGYSGNQWDNSEKDRDAFYTEDPGKATEDQTFEYAPGVYTYAGWYEVHADGTETPYDFSQHVDHDTILRLHWKKTGLYYVEYDAGTGSLSGSQDAGVYADHAGVLINCSATAPAGYTFEGWQVRGDASGHLYRIGETFLLSSDYAVTVGGKNTVYLDAVYTKACTAKIIYDPNGGTFSGTTENIDFGSPSDALAPTPLKTVADGKAMISKLVNNSSFILSDGKLLDDSDFAVKRTDVSGNNMTLVGWSTKANYKPGDPFYELGGEYGVDSEDPVVLYAVWQVKVSYHLNTESTDAAWGGDWTESGYTYDSTENTYVQAVYLGNTVSEPTYIPTDIGENVFLYWMSEPTGDSVYLFSAAVSQDLNLYAKWGTNHVTAHAVDASAAAFEERGSSDGWTVSNIEIGANPVPLTETSHVRVPSGSDYVYAFAAVSGDIASVSEGNAVTNVFYNRSDKQVYVTYASGGTAPLGDEEIYFVYYLKKSLDIGYKSMDSAGVLAPASGNLDINSSAPLSTGNIGTYDMETAITQPKGWVSDSTLTHYSFAIGNANAENASHLHVITTASGDDNSRPSLQIRNTWRGYQYSIDGSSWVSCGYEPALYVVYFTQQPTIVMIEEETVGTDSAIAGQHFDYQVVVKQTETDTTDPDNPVVTETSSVFDGTYRLPDDEGNTAQSAILFYNKDGNKETTQTVTVTQTAKDGFTTTINAAGKGTVTENERKWSYTTGATVESPKVVFTNTQTALPVTVHVALIDTSNSTIVLDDTMRSATYSFTMDPGDEKTFLTELPSTTVFGGDSSAYEFGAILYGTDDGSKVTPSSMEVAKIAFAKVSGNQYELVLRDSEGNTLTELDGYNIYYLYYPMPQIKYVKLSPDGNTLTAIKGSLDGTSDTDTITYGNSELTMNGAQVSQGQRFAVPMSGFRITQEVGTNTFRMPPILDDGIYTHYLSYSKLGAGNANDISRIADLGNENISSSLTMYLRVHDNALQWCFTGENGDWHTFTGTPTVYAIYEERGYDLQITKSVPGDVGDHATFTLTIKSAAITKNEYDAEGYSGTPVITPASESTPGSIVLNIEDGTTIKIIGLGQGSYSVTETGNNNYNLTAKCGPLHGNPEDVPVTKNSLTISLDREKKLELTNTHKAICKITVNGTEHPFYTLQSAAEYVKANLPSSSPVYIQMLTDYTMPSSDVPVIPAGYTIVLNTADTSGGTYNFDGGKSGTSSGATVTRAADYTRGPMITNCGTLTLENLTLDGNNVEADNAMILSTGSVNVSTGSLLQNAKNTAGNGGAICSTAGTVTVSATVKNNNALSGGAVYSEGSSITVTGTLFGNRAQNGGAIYYKGNGSISVSGSASISNNKATGGSGGAIYATAGTIAVSGGSMTKNTASGNGGAIYTVDGAVNVSGGTIGGTGNANSAINGSAAFIQSGSASFSGGSITANTATSGGAIGVGGTSARLYFSGAASITGNTMAGSASSVYLNQDTDAIINAEGLAAGAEIGIYVSGDISADLFKNRGVPGAKFGVYSDAAGITAFKNDRLSGITVTADTAARRLVWGKSIQVQVRYMETFASAFPQKSGGNWNGTQKYPASGWEASYYLPANENAASAIADDLRSKYKLNLTNTAAFACAFMDDGTDVIGFEDYVTEVNWDSSENSWKFTKRGGTVVPGEKLVVYFSEPAYINIENNTSFPLTITELSLRGKTATSGYGYVFAVNGAVQDGLLPITADDLKLGAGKSLKLMFPGGLYSQTYTLKGGFTVGSSVDDIPVRQTGVSISTLSGDTRTDFTLSSGKTGSAKGSTVDVIFGGSKPICKIVTTEIDGVQDSEIAGVDNPDEDGVAYLFSSLQQAVTFAQNHSLTEAVIELLVDYLIPGTDAVSIPEGYNLTFTTAIGDTEQDYNYSSDSSARATISRDNSNTGSFIVVDNGNNATKLTVENLIFDGKNYAGNVEGGVIKTKDCEVEIENCDFQNCIANDGGGIKVEFVPSETNYSKAKLTVTGCSFTNCISKGSTRQGGGAIWTNACSFTLTGAMDTNGNYTSGVFNSCEANDQGGAVFHRIDWMYPEAYRTNSETTVRACKFINCKAQAAGGLEIDSYRITTSDCWFENCQGTTRNAGGFNVFIQYKPNNNPNENDDMNPPVSATGTTELRVTNCTFKSCTANQRGGGFRTLTHETTLADCTFTDNTAGSESNGGGISITNQNATEATIKGCTIQNCSAKNGGGVFFDGSLNTNAKLTIMDDPDTNRQSVISGNTAFNQGGGVYTGSATTLINTQIQNNTLTTGTVNNAAGMYVNSKTLTIGKTGAEVDTTVITNNTVSGGGASNLHLWGGSNKSSIVVNCDLSVGSHIGVTNPGAVGQQFGTSPNSTTSPPWRPHGLADPTPDDPDYYPTFVADSGSVYGIIDRSDESGKSIVWGGPPICKITDAKGNLLYLDGARKYPAIFDALEGGSAGKWTSAFSALGVQNPVLYSSDGNPYETKIYKIQMLVEEYALGSTATTFIVPNNGQQLDITLTTCNTTSGDYPYRGTPGSVTTIVRKSGFDKSKSMFSVGTKLTFADIILDGGAGNGLSLTANGSVLNITGSRYSCAILDAGSIVRNATTTGKGTIFVDWGDFTLKGGTIQNCTANKGGAIYMKSRTQTGPARGYLKLESGNILGCSAEKGGGVYVETGTFTMTAVSIRDCVATTDGGGIYFAADGQNPTNEFTMSGGTISNCTATNGSGGGVYVNNGKIFNMSGGFIMGNSAETNGGGIAVGNSGATLNFSRTPWIASNRCDSSVADDNACNVELSLDKNTIINTNGIWNGARIGVYVTGAEAFSPYVGHGREGDPFGTFKNASDVSYLYGFVNDYNGLKGGLATGQNPSSDKKIYWIKIFSLEISKEVNSYQNDNDEEFRFKVTLTGTATDGTVSEDINSGAEPEKYGGLYFVNGVATQMVVKDGETTQIVDLILKSGESVTAERLPAGLNYTVEELMTDDQKKTFAAMPDETIRGYIGEYAESTTRNRYLSTAEFTNLRPVCKVEGDSENMLYYKTAVEYNWNDNGSFVVESYDHYQPAVYATLEEAFEVINNGAPRLYFKGNDRYYEFTGNSYHIAMLAPYTLQNAETVNSGKTITIKTAGVFDPVFPYQGSGNTTISRGGFASDSMFTAEGELILRNIILDGRKTAYTATANGGIVNVPDGGKLTVESGAILRNSLTTGNGGAVYAAAGGTVNVTGGIINMNAVNGTGVGAGIYLVEGASLKLKGDPFFGGTGVYNDGSINLTTGNIQSGKDRQDIFISGYASTNDEDTSANSLDITGNITSGGGTIWVWAAESPRYKTLRQFAKYEDGVTNTAATLAAFRNARPDNETGADQVGRYLYGITKSDDTGKNVFWYGLSGYDVKFKKIDGFGNALEGAVFSLYTDPACTDTVKVSGTAVTGTADGSGVVIFNNKIPNGVYYMKETTIPTGYGNSNIYIVLVGDKALAKDDLDATAIGYLADISPETITGQTALYKTAYQDTESDYDKYAVFLIDSTTSRAVTTPDIAKYGIMNTSTAERKAILRKVSNTYTPLDGAVFEILRYDHTLVSSTDINGATTTSFTSGASGVYFIDMLPFGTYYLHETTIPSGYQEVTAGDDGNWFILTVSDEPIIKEISPEETTP